MNKTTKVGFIPFLAVIMVWLVTAKALSAQTDSTSRETAKKANKLIEKGHQAFEAGNVKEAIRYYNQSRWQLLNNDSLALKAKAGCLALKTLLYTPRRDTTMGNYYDTFKALLPQLKQKFPNIYQRCKILSLNIDFVNSNAVKPVAEALDSFGQAQDLQKAKDPFVWSAYQGLQGAVHLRQSKAQQALTAIQRASRTYDSTTQPQWLMPAMQAYHQFYKALAYRSIGKHDSALAMVMQMRHITSQAFPGDHPINARMYYTAGDIYRSLAEPLKASKAFNKCIDILEKHNLSLTRLGPLVYREKGNLFVKNFQLKRGITYLQKALHLLENAYPSAPEKQIYTKMDLGKAYRRQKAYGQAKAITRDALNLALGLKASPLKERVLINLYNNLSIINREQGDYQKANKHLKKALESAKAYYPSAHLKIGKIHINLMSVAIEQKQLDVAWENLSKARGIYQKRLSQQAPQYGRQIYTNKALIKSEKGEFSAAYDYLKQAYQTFHKRPDVKLKGFIPTLNRVQHPTEAFQTTSIHGQVLWYAFRQSKQAKPLSQALQVYQLADSLVENLQKQSYLTANQSGLAKHAAKIYPYGVAACFQLTNHPHATKPNEYYSKLAFRLSEKGKTLQLLESLSKIRQHQSENIPDSLENAFQSLVKQINQLEGGANASQSTKTKLVDLKSQKSRLLETIKQQYPSFYAISFHDQVVPLETVKEHLSKENKNLISYTLRDSLLYGILITPNSTHIKSLGNGNSIEDSLKTYRQKLGQEKRFDLNLSHFLYHTLFQPFEPELKKRDVVVVPDGPISHLAFSTLVRAPEKPNQPQYLIKDYTFSYSPSASLWIHQQAKGDLQSVSGLAANGVRFSGFAPGFEQGRQENVLVAGKQARERYKPIPGAEDEVIFGYKLLGGETFTGNRATETAFKTAAKHSQILHLATHGIVSDQTPAYSRLLFEKAKQQKEDGSLYTHELYQLDLKADLAVLSACNTGYGPLMRGQGHMSMARGFKLAGCQNVIMTLWQIQDRISNDLMRAFYRHLDKGKDVDRALRDAKLQYLKTHDRYNSNPYYWGGLVIMGSNQPVVLENESSIPDDLWIWLILGGVLLITIAGIAYGWYLRG